MTAHLMAIATNDECDDQFVPVLPRGIKCVDKVLAELKPKGPGAVTHPILIAPLREIAFFEWQRVDDKARARRAEQGNDAICGPSSQQEFKAFTKEGIKL